MATFGTFTAGQVLTASELNAAGTYTAYTPTWTNLTVGNGTNNFRYCKFNKFVHTYGYFVLGTTSTVTGQIRMSLPVTAQNSALGNFFGMGGGSFEDPGFAIYTMQLYFVSSSTIELFPLSAAGTFVKDDVTSATKPMTWAANDKINVSMVYEAA